MCWRPEVHTQPEAEQEEYKSFLKQALGLENLHIHFSFVISTYLHKNGIYVFPCTC